ncbi:hypothetical protein GPECTOR_14g81 [Gonium pectorale]|uniref:Uncharacterized protein n=1 Tax=Gonium pectorale TaxID=33097 RepID=A0A150GMP7_GONPE|nr:hypothetical protein GPECTOR_14g81 [Gonium pectorale]|eukprot:KXZ51099.1 hypothetical protein GPECTOR_14g81 [Gonium pectorale]
MAHAKPFLGMHLVDVAKVNPMAQSHITFYLSKGPCTCQLQHQQHQQQGAAAAAAGPSGAAAAGRAPVGAAGQGAAVGKGARRDDIAAAPEATIGDGGQDESGESEGDASSGSESDIDSGDGAGDESGRKRRRGGGSSRSRTQHRNVRRRVSADGQSRAVAAVPERGPPAPGQRRCRCPCHARRLTQVVVSREDIEEMEEKNRTQAAGKAFRKQQTGGRDPPAQAAVAPAPGLRPPLPRMMPTPVVPTRASATAGAAAGDGSAPTRTRPATAARGSGSALHRPAAAGAAAALFTAGAAAAVQRGYIELGESKTQTPCVRDRVHIRGALLKQHFPSDTKIRMVVEVDGALPPQEPHIATIGRYSSTNVLLPTPTLAAGRRCVGWGLLPGRVLVMLVVSANAGTGAVPAPDAADVARAVPARGSGVTAPAAGGRRAAEAGGEAGAARAGAADEVAGRKRTLALQREGRAAEFGAAAAGP